MVLRQAIPKNKTGIEIGVGTGRFAEPLNIKFGVEPSENMARVAEQRGITVYGHMAKNLPIENEIELPLKGYGQGSFVVIRAVK